jgi:hypothetical protein
MSVRFWTNNARGLLYAFEQAVYDKQIPSWTQNADQDFLHNSDFLKDKALMRPRVYSDALGFAIIQLGPEEITDQLYGMFQASMIQSFLASFSDRFTLADASAKFRERDGDMASLTSPALGRHQPHRTAFSIVARESKLARAAGSWAR